MTLSCHIYLHEAQHDGFIQCCFKKLKCEAFVFLLRCIIAGRIDIVEMSLFTTLIIVTKSPTCCTHSNKACKSKLFWTNPRFILLLYF